MPAGTNPAPDLVAEIDKMAAEGSQGATDQLRLLQGQSQEQVRQQRNPGGGRVDRSGIDPAIDVFNDPDLARILQQGTPGGGRVDRSGIDTAPDMFNDPSIAGILQQQPQAQEQPRFLPADLIEPKDRKVSWMESFDRGFDSNITGLLADFKAMEALFQYAAGSDTEDILETLAESQHHSEIAERYLSGLVKFRDFTDGKAGPLDIIEFSGHATGGVAPSLIQAGTGALLGAAAGAVLGSGAGPGGTAGGLVAGTGAGLLKSLFAKAATKKVRGEVKKAALDKLEQQLSELGREESREFARKFLKKLGINADDLADFANTQSLAAYLVSEATKRVGRRQAAVRGGLGASALVAPTQIGGHYEEAATVAASRTGHLLGDPDSNLPSAGVAGASVGVGLLTTAIALSGEAILLNGLAKKAFKGVITKNPVAGKKARSFFLDVPAEAVKGALKLSVLEAITEATEDVVGQTFRLTYDEAYEYDLIRTAEAFATAAVGTLAFGGAGGAAARVVGGARQTSGAQADRFNKLLHGDPGAEYQGAPEGTTGGEGAFTEAGIPTHGRTADEDIHNNWTPEQRAKRAAKIRANRNANPEPVSDIIAQIQALFTEDNGKDTVFIPEGIVKAAAKQLEAGVGGIIELFNSLAQNPLKEESTPGYLESGGLVARAFYSPGHELSAVGPGFIISRNVDSLNDLKANRLDEVSLARALGYSGVASTQAGQVHVVLDSDQNVVFSEAFAKKNAKRVRENAIKLFPEGSYSHMQGPVGEALKNRKQQGTNNANWKPAASVAEVAKQANEAFDTLLPQLGSAVDALLKAIGAKAKPEEKPAKGEPEAKPPETLQERTAALQKLLIEGLEAIVTGIRAGTLDNTEIKTVGQISDVAQQFYTDANNAVDALLTSMGGKNVAIKQKFTDMVNIIGKLISEGLLNQQRAEEALATAVARAQEKAAPKPKAVPDVAAIKPLVDELVAAHKNLHKHFHDFFTKKLEPKSMVQVMQRAAALITKVKLTIDEQATSNPLSTAAKEAIAEFYQIALRVNEAIPEATAFRGDEYAYRLYLSKTLGELAVVLDRFTISREAKPKPKPKPKAESTQARATPKEGDETFVFDLDGNKIKVKVTAVKSDGTAVRVVDEAGVESLVYPKNDRGEGPLSAGWFWHNPVETFGEMILGVETGTETVVRAKDVPEAILKNKIAQWEKAIEGAVDKDGTSKTWNLHDFSFWIAQAKRELASREKPAPKPAPKPEPTTDHGEVVVGHFVHGDTTADFYKGQKTPIKAKDASETLLKSRLAKWKQEFREGPSSKLKLLISQVERELASREGQPAAKPEPVAQSPIKDERLQGTKIVDAEGQPLVVYHGSLADFTEFDSDKLGSRTGYGNHRALKGFFFSNRNLGYDQGIKPMTAKQKKVEERLRVEMGAARELAKSNPSAANEAAGDKAANKWWAYRGKHANKKSNQVKGYLYEVYLNIQNPLYTKGVGIFSEMIAEAKAAGHDGIIASDWGGEAVGNIIYVAFSAEQIINAKTGEVMASKKPPAVDYGPLFNDTEQVHNLTIASLAAKLEAAIATVVRGAASGKPKALKHSLTKELSAALDAMYDSILDWEVAAREFKNKSPDRAKLGLLKRTLKPHREQFVEALNVLSAASQDATTGNDIVSGLVAMLESFVANRMRLDNLSYVDLLFTVNVLNEVLEHFEEAQITPEILARTYSEMQTRVLEQPSSVTDALNAKAKVELEVVSAPEDTADLSNRVPTIVANVKQLHAILNHWEPTRRILPEGVYERLRLVTRNYQVVGTKLQTELNDLLLSLNQVQQRKLGRKEKVPRQVKRLEQAIQQLETRLEGLSLAMADPMAALPIEQVRTEALYEFNAYETELASQEASWELQSKQHSLDRNEAEQQVSTAEEIEAGVAADKANDQAELAEGISDEDAIDSGMQELGVDALAEANVWEDVKIYRVRQAEWPNEQEQVRLLQELMEQLPGDLASSLNEHRELLSDSAINYLHANMVKIQGLHGETYSYRFTPIDNGEHLLIERIPISLDALSFEGSRAEEVATLVQQLKGSDQRKNNSQGMYLVNMQGKGSLKDNTYQIDLFRMRKVLAMGERRMKQINIRAGSSEPATWAENRRRAMITAMADLYLSGYDLRVEINGTRISLSKLTLGISQGDYDYLHTADKLNERLGKEPSKIQVYYEKFRAFIKKPGNIKEIREFQLFYEKKKTGRETIEAVFNMREHDDLADPRGEPGVDAPILGTRMGEFFAHDSQFEFIGESEWMHLGDEATNQSPLEREMEDNPVLLQAESRLQDYAEDLAIAELQLQAEHVILGRRNRVLILKGTEEVDPDIGKQIAALNVEFAHYAAEQTILSDDVDIHSGMLAGLSKILGLDKGKYITVTEGFGKRWQNHKDVRDRLRKFMEYTNPTYRMLNDLKFRNYITAGLEFELWRRRYIDKQPAGVDMMPTKAKIRTEYLAAVAARAKQRKPNDEFDNMLKIHWDGTEETLLVEYLENAVALGIGSAQDTFAAYMGLVRRYAEMVSTFNNKEDVYAYRNLRKIQERIKRINKDIGALNPKFQIAVRNMSLNPGLDGVAELVAPLGSGDKAHLQVRILKANLAAEQALLTSRKAQDLVDKVVVASKTEYAHDIRMLKKSIEHLEQRIKTSERKIKVIDTKEKSISAGSLVTLVKHANKPVDVARAELSEAIKAQTALRNQGIHRYKAAEADRAVPHVGLRDGTIAGEPVQDAIIDYPVEYEKARAKVAAARAKLKEALANRRAPKRKRRSQKKLAAVRAKLAEARTEEAAWHALMLEDLAAYEQQLKVYEEALFEFETGVVPPSTVAAMRTIVKQRVLEAQQRLDRVQEGIKNLHIEPEYTRKITVRGNFHPVVNRVVAEFARMFPAKTGRIRILDRGAVVENLELLAMEIEHAEQTKNTDRLAKLKRSELQLRAADKQLDESNNLGVQYATVTGKVTNYTIIINTAGNAAINPLLSKVEITEAGIQDVPTKLGARVALNNRRASVDKSVYDLMGTMTAYVLAHELGHVLLHSEYNNLARNANGQALWDEYKELVRSGQIVDGQYTANKAGFIEFLADQVAVKVMQAAKSRRDITEGGKSREVKGMHAAIARIARMLTLWMDVVNKKIFGGRFSRHALAQKVLSEIALESSKRAQSNLDKSRRQHPRGPPRPVAGPDVASDGSFEGEPDPGDLEGAFDSVPDEAPAAPATRTQAEENAILRENNLLDMRLANSAAKDFVADPENDVYIGRPGRGQKGIWGNPFPLKGEQSRDSVIEQYQEYLLGNLDLASKLRGLKNKRLVCFCKPKHCHGDVLIRAANAVEYIRLDTHRNSTPHSKETHGLPALRRLMEDKNLLDKITKEPVAAPEPAASGATNSHPIAGSAVFHTTRGPHGGLSNFAEGYPLEIFGMPVPTSEHLYQALKFGKHPEIALQILQAKTPRAAKKISRDNNSKIDSSFHRARVGWMNNVLTYKLAQNFDRFSKELLGTGKKPIVEKSTFDAYWGAKPDNKGNLVGENTLGKLLTELREYAELLAAAAHKPEQDIEIDGATKAIEATLKGVKKLLAGTTTAAEPAATSRVDPKYQGVKIISGGQTGADIAGLEAGRALGLKTGGIAPKGYRIQGGTNPALKDFGVTEHSSDQYRPRTIINVATSDVTFIFGDPTSPGSRLTVNAANGKFGHKKTPLIYVREFSAAEMAKAREVLDSIPSLKVINVAGNRETSTPGINAQTRAFLEELLSVEEDRDTDRVNDFLPDTDSDPTIDHFTLQDTKATIDKLFSKRALRRLEQIGMKAVRGDFTEIRAGIDRAMDTKPGKMVQKGLRYAWGYYAQFGEPGESIANFFQPEPAHRRNKNRSSHMGGYFELKSEAYNRHTTKLLSIFGLPNEVVRLKDKDQQAIDRAVILAEDERVATKDLTGKARQVRELVNSVQIVDEDRQAVNYFPRQLNFLALQGSLALQNSLVELMNQYIENTPAKNAKFVSDLVNNPNKAATEELNAPAKDQERDPALYPAISGSTNPRPLWKIPTAELRRRGILEAPWHTLLMRLNSMASFQGFQQAGNAMGWADPHKGLTAAVRRLPPSGTSRNQATYQHGVRPGR